MPFKRNDQRKLVGINMELGAAGKRADLSDPDMDEELDGRHLMRYACALRRKARHRRR